jgi:Uri superfamily endonuclease
MILPPVDQRLKGTLYIKPNGEKVIWDGKCLRCEHNYFRSQCRKCLGNGICVHNIRRTRCYICHGGSVCVHSKRKNQCAICDIEGYLKCLLRSRLNRKIKNHHHHGIMNYLGCNIKDFFDYLERKFEKGMTWDNQGEWHIDHIKPCSSFDLSLDEEIQKCFHYTNLQPLWGEDNIKKSNNYSADDDMRLWNVETGWILTHPTHTPQGASSPV